MNKKLVCTDSFVLKKRKLRIYSVAEGGSGTIFWTTEQQAVQYVQKIHIQRLFSNKEAR